MGRRGEVFTRKIFVKEGEKTYFFNIKENRYGEIFLNLVESSKRDSGEFMRKSIMVYKEDFHAFQEGFRVSLDYLRGDRRENFSLEKGEEQGRRKYHFSVKWNKFKWGSLFVSEERLGTTPDNNNNSLLVDERDMDDFLKGYFTVIQRFQDMINQKGSREQNLPKKKVQIKNSSPKKESRRRIVVRKT